MQISFLWKMFASSGVSVTEEGTQGVCSLWHNSLVTMLWTAYQKFNVPIIHILVPDLDLFHSGAKVASSQVKTDVAEVVKLMLKFFLLPHTFFLWEADALFRDWMFALLCVCLSLFCAFWLHASKTPSNRRRISKSLVCSGLSGHISMQKIVAMAAAFILRSKGRLNVPLVRHGGKLLDVGDVMGMMRHWNRFLREVMDAPS